ncbi:MAG: hypothetical protein MUE83_11030, partial [Tabrizicola sp.]|nr:hypothetical protein [Tabrizicola sp.]
MLRRPAEVSGLAKGGSVRSGRGEPAPWPPARQTKQRRRCALELSAPYGKIHASMPGSEQFVSSVFHVSNRKSINWAFGLFVVLLFLVLRVPATGSLFNMDEKIAPAVIAGMIQRGDLNGNWMVAEGIPVEFQVNQFNFYSYHLFSWIFYSEESKQFIKNLRLVNVALQAGTLILLIAYLSRFKVTLPRQIMALALFVTSPAMVFDTHIARAECFLYFLFALLLWTTLWSRRPILRYAVFGALLGVGCASKITFILCGAILLPEIVTTLRADWTKALKQLGILILACVLGFAATAPYVFVDFNAFLAGVHALFNQYGTGHPPHSFIEASVGRSVWHTLTFVVLTTGALLPLALFQLLRRPLHAPGLALFGLLLIAYFATKPVFFERNIGIGQLALLTFVVLNFRTKAETLALAASCVLMMYWSFHT